MFRGIVTASAFIIGLGMNFVPHTGHSNTPPSLMFNIGQNFGNGPAENADINAIQRMIDSIKSFRPNYSVFAVLNVTQANKATLLTTLNALRDNGVPFILDVYSSDVLTNSRAVDVYDVQHGIPLSLTDLQGLKNTYGTSFAGVRVFETFALNFTIFACHHANPEWCTNFVANLPSDNFFQAGLLEPFMQFAHNNGMFLLFEDPYWFFDHTDSNPLLNQVQNEQDLKTLLTTYPNTTIVMYANNEANSQSVNQLGLWQAAMAPFVTAGAIGMGLGDQAWICSAAIGVPNEANCPVDLLITWAKNAFTTGSKAVEVEPYWYWWDLPKGQIELPTGAVGASGVPLPTLVAFNTALQVADNSYTPGTQQELLNQFQTCNDQGLPDGCITPRNVRNVIGSVPALAQGVPNNNALKAFPTSSSRVVRAGFTAAGDGGAAVYNLSNSPCTLRGGNGDDGSQVRASNGNCWIADFGATPANVLQWGAKTDDSTDLGQFMQAAYDANVGCVRIPAGIYRIAGPVAFAQQLPCFFGDGVSEAVDKAAKIGTWIHIVSNLFSPFSIIGSTGQGAVASGFYKMGFFQDHPTITAGWHPTVYPPIFTLTNRVGRIDFMDLNFYNIYACISAINSARLHINRIMGQPVGPCLQFDQQHDVNYIDNIQFWPFWTTSGSDQTNVFNYTSINVDPIIFKRSDSPFIGRVFVLGYHSGINFASSSDGPTTGAMIDDLLVDAGQYGIWITGNNSQFQVNNFRHSGGTLVGGVAIPNSEAFRDESNASVASIANFDCFFEGASCVHLAGTANGELQIANPQIWNFNNDNNGSAGIVIDHAGVIKLANPPGVVNPAHGGTLLPAVTVHPGSDPNLIPSTTLYIMPGVSQSWTPRLEGITNVGTPSYTTQLGSFWDDGAKVIATFNIQVNGTLGGATGSIAIKGMPRRRTGLTGQDGSCTISSKAGIVLGGGYTTMNGLIPGGPGVNQILLAESGPGVPTILVPESAFESNTIFQGECTYRWN